MENLRVLQYKYDASEPITVEAYLRGMGYSHAVLSHLIRTSILPPLKRTVASQKSDASSTANHDADLMQNFDQDCFPGEYKMTSAISSAGVFRNGQPVRMIDLLSKGDELTIGLLETEDSPKVEAAKLSLEIVYEDEDFAVINKPAGMPVHPSMEHYRDTVSNAFAYHMREECGCKHYVNRVVNRLDRDTSGLMIMAKNMLSACLLDDMIARREIHRTYLALAEGDVQDLTEKDLPGIYCHAGYATIVRPIARVEGSVLQREINYEKGEYAVTHLTLLRYFPDKNVSLLQLRLGTGRTHQIRVHMSSVGHPLLGDFLYNPEDTRLPRQALHSFSLDLRHPITGKSLHFETPLPEDIHSFLTV